jgi:hypothetical protein
MDYPKYRTGSIPFQVMANACRLQETMPYCASMATIGPVTWPLKQTNNLMSKQTKPVKKATRKIHPDIGYLTGIVTDAGVVAIIAASEEMENKEMPHGFLAILKDKTWSIFLEDMDIISITAGKGSLARHVGYLATDGRLAINEPTGARNEHVHKGKNGPGKLRPMSEIRVIGDYFIAVGMRRQVYRRKLLKGTWARFDEGVLLDEKSLEIAGFLSVDGANNNELYAVGYQGEIWLRTAKEWQPLKSPVTTRLECVRCGADGSVLICGENGVVLKGNQKQWQLVDAKGISNTLKSAAQFKGQWYVADEEGGLYIIKEDGIYIEPEFAKLKATTGSLSSTDTALLSVGETDIVLFDGKKWTRLKDPGIDPK